MIVRAEKEKGMIAETTTPFETRDTVGEQLTPTVDGFRFSVK